MARAATIASEPHATGAEARLQLLEALLVADEPSDCAQRALDWLGRHARLSRARLIAFEPERRRVVVLASLGEARRAVDELEIEDEHPLLPLLEASDTRPPVVLSRPRGVGLDGPVLAFALAGAGAALLVPPSIDKVDLRWFVDAVARSLGRVRSLRRLEIAERTLGRERTLLNTILNSVPDPVLLTDSDSRLVLANARAESLFVADESSGEGRRRAVQLNNMLFSAALTHRAMDEREPERRELLLVHPTEGTDLLYELIASAAHDPREGTGVVSVLRNVNDLRRATEEIEENYRRLRVAEAAVRAERDRLDLIIDSVADPILVTDPAGNIVHMNAPAERLFNPTGSDDAAAQRAVRHNDAHFSSFVSGLFLATDEARLRAELQLLDPERGRPVPIEAIAGKVVSDQGEVTAVVTILHDQTEALEKARLYEQLKRASDELEAKVQAATAELVHRNELLQRQALQLEQASALKSQFLANISHEFRTPLNAILGYTSMLLAGVGGGELEAHQKKQLQRVDSNSRHLLAIINDVLDIARIEAGRMPLRVEPFALDELVTEVLSEVEPLIARSRLAVERSVAPGLPDMESDRQKVKQIVLNLLTNALKFTPAGSVRVEVAYLRGPDEVEIAVADTGVGIAPEDQEKVFEEFRQADNAPRAIGGGTGTGLGLAICRRLASTLGGRIRLRSQLGRGSIFTLTLPRRRKSS